MAIIKRKLRTCRPKALFGADGALMATAIALQTINDTANTVMSVKQAKEQARATTNAAKTQADAITKQAAAQAKAMAETNDNNNSLQERLIEANKEMYKEQTNAIKDINTNMLIAQGQQNVDTRKEQSKLVVKRGGNIRHKLRNVPSINLPINGNMPFRVIDGGFADYLGMTSEGYDLYELIGNDHDHYHKTKGGKYRSGVGVKFNDGTTGNNVVVEGEGNQSSSTGELMLVTPDDAMFLSKHSIKGFNPTKAVKAGLNPLKAFYMQETLKNNRVKNNKHRNLASDGTIVYVQQPDMITDTILARSRNLTAQDNKDIIKNGYNILDGQMNQLDLSRTNALRAKKGCSLKRVKAWDGLSKWWNDQNSMQKLGWIGIGAGALGATAATIGNVVGSKWVRNANNKAANLLGTAWDTYGTTMADAWRSRKGIDENLVNKEDYDVPNAVATIRTARVNKNAELTNLDRRENRARRLLRQNTLSSAKRQILEDELADKYNAARAEIYQQQANEAEDIKQKNAQLLNYMSIQNAEQKARAMEEYNKARTQVAIYNNDILNENILGAADAETTALLNKSGIQADTYKLNAQSKANAMNNSIATWNNAIQSGIGTYSNLYQALLGADKDVLESLGLLKKAKYGGKLTKHSLKRSNPILVR